jgi:methionyl-tRNA formyltransferase
MLLRCCAAVNKHLLQLDVSFEAHADKISAVNREALTQALQAVIQEFNKRVQTTAGLPMFEPRITSAESMQSYHQQLSSEAVEDHRGSKPRPGVAPAQGC